MSTKQRLETIKEFLEGRQYLTINDISNSLNVSPSTVRRDLKQLEEEEVVQLFYGGVVTKSSAVLEPFGERATKYAEEKTRIGIRAAQMITNGDVVIIDGGTTAFQVALALVERKDLQNITVITPVMNVARCLLGVPGVSVIMTGGELSSETYDMTGHIAVESYRSLHASVAFLGCHGITAETGIMYPNSALCELTRAILQAAKKVILVADHSKIGRVSVASAFSVSEMCLLITDEASPVKELECLRASGLTVDVV